MHHFIIALLLAPFTAAALMIAAEQEDSTYPHSGFSPECPDYEFYIYENTDD